MPLRFADVAAEDRRRKLDRKRGRHLAMIGDLVPQEDFRPVLETVWRKPDDERKSAAGLQDVRRLVGLPCAQSHIIARS